MRLPQLFIVSSTTSRRSSWLLSSKRRSIQPFRLVSTWTYSTTGLNSRTARMPVALDRSKREGYEFYRDVLQSPKFIVAPMVDGSELAWRILSRYYGAELCYTPMIHAALFAEPRNTKYRQEQFDVASVEEGAEQLDRPLIAQFCANEPATLLSASDLIIRPGDPESTEILHRVDGFDLNLGCPQGIAKKGKYGAFLMDHLDLISQLISHLHQHSPLPVTAKFRRFQTIQETNSYTELLIKSGAQILTLHGRTREQKGQFTGLADWKMIEAAVRTSHQHKIPIFGNGNVLTSFDALRLIDETGADGVMTAEGNLYNPAIFAPLNPDFIKKYRDNLPQKFKDGFELIDQEYRDPEGLLGSKESLLHYPNCTKVASQYLMICRTLDTRTATSAIKGHLYKLFRSVFDTGRYNDIREVLAQISWFPKSKEPTSTPTDEPPSGKRDKATYPAVLDQFQHVIDLIKQRLETDRTNGLLNEADIDMSIQIGKDEGTTDYLKRLQIPYSRCQPYVRPLQELVSKKSSDEKTHTPSDAASDQPPKTIQLLGPPKCSNPAGCLNSGAAKCKWTLCKTCCAQKTSIENSSESNMAERDDEMKCEVHSLRAKLEIEKRRLKAEKRKQKLVTQQRQPKQPRLAV
ncbi:hypothetical protein O181_082156 [Austropuccinia psidii MF-1]|uniref:DUS-like FMN-binding domain-containing protein n=1 Tax=Austropuccinia psidii MF-1 TaxID=1389203 RepID=A0A9Q3IGN0_9BASI|nr:hypothetical protein [Austropuccinia psidii MF-1]